MGIVRWIWVWWMGDNLAAELDIWRCTRCGACLATCPTYRALGRETESPRGRLALARAWQSGELELGPNTAGLLYRCALCAACSAACPGGLQVDEILLDLRGELAGRQLLPEALARLQAAVEERHNILGEEQAARELWREGLPEAEARRPAEIVYFVGCVSALFPSGYAVPQQMVRLLAAGGLDYTLLGGREWCCGYPLLLNGRAEALAGIAAELVRRVEELGARTLVTSCPSCYYVWRHVYPRLVPEMRLEVLHASELLLRAISAGSLRPAAIPDLAVTYHDPCDLGRRSGLYDPPREVLRAIPGLRLLEMRDRRENALCCGGGGNLETCAPELVGQAAARRLRQAVETGAEAIVTACPQCRRTLAAAARREKVRLRVWDVAEVLARALS